MGRECCGGERRYSAPAPAAANRNSGMYIPSEEMGDYEQMRDRRPKKSGPLYPLDEEGTYGAPPSALPKPLPPYAKRERKPKQYAGYAVSNECSMHAEKLEQNESVRGRTPPRRGKTPPTRKDSGPSRPVDPAPSRPREPPAPIKRRDSTRRESTGRRDSVSRRESVSRRDSMKRESVSRDTAYTPGGKTNWQNSLRGASPSTPRIQRRPSIRSNSSTLPRQTRTSASPSRPRTISTSPDRFRKQSMSPDRGVGGGGGGGRSSTDWGYTSLDNFTANRKNSDYSTTSNRKYSADRKSSTTSSRKDSVMSARKDSRDMSADYSRKSSGRDSYSSGRDYSSSAKDYSNSSTNYSSGSANYSSGSTNYSSGSTNYNKGSRSSSPSKIALSALKTPVITEWDELGVLGLSSKMFKDSTTQQESYLSSSSYIRRESVTTKVM